MGKGVYHYKYINDCNKVNEASLPEKEDFYSHFNTEDINMQITNRQKEFLNTLKYLREYYNFYIQRETLLLTDVFENF